MATASGRAPDDLSEPAGAEAAPGKGSAAERLATEPFAFDFFQAVRLLHLLRPEAAEVGGGGPVESEPVRFRALASTGFPPSAITDLEAPPGAPHDPPTMTVSFFGLIGPKGVLPQGYTEAVMRRERETAARDPEKGALRAWFDLFNHRLTGLFYRAWQKYRPFVTFERAARKGDVDAASDPFTAALLALVGLGTGGQRGRAGGSGRVDDLGLLFFAGLLARRPRDAAGLEALLREYFGRGVEVRQFQGQWLVLEEEQRSRLGGGLGMRNGLGRDAVAGARVWERQSKVRVRVGPLGLGEFRAFLPDAGPGGAFPALVGLTRFYLGPDLDFDVQLFLAREEVPAARLAGPDSAGALLGWDAWIASRPLDSDRDDAIFEGGDALAPSP